MSNDLYWRLPLIVSLLVMSGTFSGLTLGLLGLDNAHLQVLVEQRVTDEESRKQAYYAGIIAPIRRKGNLLLTTLLLGNVAVNVALSIILADLINGLLGFVLSTVLIVLFGEIIPQSVCSRYGLQIGAKVIWLMKLLIFCLYIMAKPISVLLDCILGDDPGTKFTKTQMKALFVIYEREHRINPEQKKILTSVLDFTEKKVADIMTPLDKIYMLDWDEELDMAKMKAIYETGYSRIPVYRGTKDNIIGILIAKDLMFVNAAKLRKLRKMEKYLLREAIEVLSSSKIHDILAAFKLGKGHMAIVKTVTYIEDADPYYRIVGVVTLEDIIECLIQDKIEDEYDLIKRHTYQAQKGNALLFSDTPPDKELTEKERRMIGDFLYKNIEPFRSRYITRKDLNRLIKRSEVITYKETANKSEELEILFNVKSEEAALETDPENESISREIYQRGKNYRHFYMVVNGSVEVFIGDERLYCEQGPYKCLGVRALLYPSIPYVPDFSAQAMPQSRVLRISQDLYRRYIHNLY